MIKVKNILLIDDDSISNAVAAALIEKMGITESITTASNGKEAITLLRNSYIDNRFPEIIFLDLKMPVMDGYEFLKAMKSIPGESKIFILSNNIHKEDFGLENNYNVVEYYVKPLSSHNLEDIIENYC